MKYAASLKSEINDYHCMNSNNCLLQSVEMGFIWIGTGLFVLFFSSITVSMGNIQSKYLNICNCIFLQAWDYTFERIDNLNSSDTGFVIFNTRVERANRTNYVINGNITFKSSFTRNPSMYYVCVLSTFFSIFERNDNN